MAMPSTINDNAVRTQTESVRSALWYERVSDISERSADMRDLSADIRERSSDMRERSADMRERSSDMRERSADMRERSSDIFERSADIRVRFSESSVCFSDNASICFMILICCGSSFSVMPGLVARRPNAGMALVVYETGGVEQVLVVACPQTATVAGR